MREPGLRTFRWLSAHDIPPGMDLRRRGWAMAEGEGAARAVTIAHVAGMDARRWVSLASRRGPVRRGRVLIVGVGCADKRSRYLDLGFGDVLGDDPDLCELEARALRVAALADSLPRQHRLGALVLDLLARDAFIDGRPLALHPREFALLWRLAETPGLVVGKRRLLADVWRVQHVPETNSLAVHIFRLRTKLALAGMIDAIQTDDTGGYRLIVPRDREGAPGGMQSGPFRARKAPSNSVASGER